MARVCVCDAGEKKKKKKWSSVHHTMQVPTKCKRKQVKKRRRRSNNKSQQENRRNYRMYSYYNIMCVRTYAYKSLEMYVNIFDTAHLITLLRSPRSFLHFCHNFRAWIFIPLILSFVMRSCWCDEYTHHKYFCVKWVKNVYLKKATANIYF